MPKNAQTTAQLHSSHTLLSSVRSVQLLSRVRLCDPMNCSMPGLPVHHQLPEFTQTHVHRVRDAIQPSHPLSIPSPPAPTPSPKLVLEKAEKPEINLPTSAGSWKKQESSRKTSISALLTMPKPLTVWITINCGKF